MLLRKFIKCFKLTNEGNKRQYRNASLLLAADHTLQTKLLAEIQTGEQAPIKRVNSYQGFVERTRRVSLLCLSLKFAFNSTVQQSPIRRLSANNYRGLNVAELVKICSVNYNDLLKGKSKDPSQIYFIFKPTAPLGLSKHSSAGYCLEYLNREVDTKFVAAQLVTRIFTKNFQTRIYFRCCNKFNKNFQVTKTKHIYQCV